MDVNISNDIRSASDAPDSLAIDPGDWVERPFPPNVGGKRDEKFDVVVRQSAFNGLYAHAHSTTDVEVCGVLLGNVCHDGQSPFLHITASIQGLHADNHAARVTFTSDTWTHFHEVLERDFPGERIVGWYHTHPGFGIFLSGMDLFIHNSFFSMPWQVAYVYDPLGGDEGFFVWRGGKATRSAALIEADAPGTKPVITQQVKRPAPEDEAEAEAGEAGTDQRPLKRLRQWLWKGSK